MDYQLRAATHQPTTRPVRGTILNTIIEDHHEKGLGHSSNESGTDTDEGTVIYNPITVDARKNATSLFGGRVTSPSINKPLPQFNKDEPHQRRTSFDELYDASDNETQFSDASSSIRDSVSSRPTSFATESTRNSVASCRSSTKSRYPAIMIPPSEMWPSLARSVKHSPAVPPTPPPKIPVSPAVLSLLPKFVPAINAPPSLDGSSMTSEQVSCISAPVTPEMLNMGEGENWNAQHSIHLRRDGDSARDDAEGESASIHGDVVIEQPINWDEIGSFPRIPGATPQELSPVMPDVRGLGVLHPASLSDQGVLLPSDALQTLTHLAPDISSDEISESSGNDQTEMRESVNPQSRPRSLDGATPASNFSDYSFAQLSIPSPGGFFSSLDNGTRHTWFPGSSKSANPPSSTTAEDFYNLPWNRPQNIVEQFADAEDASTVGPPTARQHFPAGSPTAPQANTDASSTATPDRGPYSLRSSVEGAKGLLRSPPSRCEYEDAYENELWETAVTHLDRTGDWLAAQTSYLSLLREPNPATYMSGSACSGMEIAHGRTISTGSSLKKGVRFLNQATQASKEDSPQTGGHEEHAYYHAFQHLVRRRRRRDGFVQGTSRFDAVQVNRVALVNEHLDRLCGKYEVVEPTRPKYSGPFSQNPRDTGVADYTPAQMAFMEVEREKGVLDQVSPTYWAVDALKYLHGGNLLLSNASKRLARAQPSTANPKGAGKMRIRALDLGGNASCDWAWHCARKFPNVGIYTVTTPSAATNSSITGPANHRLIVTPQPWKLPFSDNYFDLISARSLHALLKHEPVPGHSHIDEYDLCLKECYRVLKPSGYLEFMLMDADISHPGPLANTMSVEFGFKLKTRGYDPTPTKTFLGRLRKTGFVGVKRAWMFLPAGAPTPDPYQPRETPSPIPPSTQGAEAVRGPVGSTAQVANVSGLVGSWMWEQWMLKLQLEMGTDKDKLLKGVAAVVEESRNCQAGWRCLSGWARKPKPSANQEGKNQTREEGKGQAAGGRRVRAATTETIHIKIEA